MACFVHSWTMPIDLSAVFALASATLAAMEVVLATARPDKSFKKVSHLTSSLIFISRNPVGGVTGLVAFIRLSFTRCLSEQSFCYGREESRF